MSVVVFKKVIMIFMQIKHAANQKSKYFLFNCFIASLSHLLTKNVENL